MTTKPTYERISELSAEVHRMKGRLTTARARGQVELHVGLDDVELLIGLASAGVRAYRLRLDAPDGGSTDTVLAAVLPVQP